MVVHSRLCIGKLQQAAAFQTGLCTEPAAASAFLDPVLNRFDAWIRLVAQSFQSIHDGRTAWHRRDAGNSVCDGCRADLPFVRSGSLAAGSVENHLDLPIREVIEQVGATFLKLANRFNLDSRFAQHLGCSAGRPQAEPKPLKAFELERRTPLGQRLAAPVGGLLTLALLAGLGLLLPVPKPQPGGTPGAKTSPAPTSLPLTPAKPGS